MFGRNPYLVPPASSRPAAVDLDGVEILLHHHHQYHHHPDASFPGLYLAAANAPAADDGAVFENGEASAAPVRKQTAKKDRHSKIHTAQGPRDRRVRLSIGIARKFFDLQEMLGFDKPSKTLDWLLTKSKAAIKELVQTASANSSSPSACEMISSENGAEAEYSNTNRRKDKAASVAKESRAKARARARERTLEKMCIKQLGGDRCDASDLNASSFECRNNQLEFLQLSAGAGFRDPVFHFPAAQDLTQESILIKRKNKINTHPSSLSGSHQNLVLNSNYIIPSANSAANENWDVFGLTSQSNLHAAFDHHKFFNSNSNI